MRKQKRKFLAGILAMLMVSTAALTGCQGNTQQPETSSSGEAPVSSETTEEKKISGDLEIQIFVGGYGETFWNEQIESFKEKYPDVNIIKQMGSQINEQLKTRWISGDAPDLVYVDGPEMPQALPQLIADGKIMDLKSFFVPRKTKTAASSKTISSAAFSASRTGKSIRLPTSSIPGECGTTKSSLPTTALSCPQDLIPLWRPAGS